MNSKFKIGERVIFEHQTLVYNTYHFSGNPNLIKSGHVTQVATISEWKQDVKNKNLFATKDEFKDAVRRASERDQFFDKAIPFLESEGGLMYKVTFDEPIKNEVLGEKITYAWYIERSLKKLEVVEAL